MRHLTAATLNIWNKSGPWRERLALIRRDIETLEPEILGLQEVLRLIPDTGPPPALRPETDQATEIAAGFGYHTAYAVASGFPGGLKFGNALLSRYPILEERTFKLPDLGSGETRSLLYALVDAPLGRLPVFVTHLNWKLNQGYVRLAQVAFIAERIDALVPEGAGLLPPVLMGDFNAEPDSDEIRFLRGLHAYQGKSAFFADAWAYGGDGSEGYTFARDNDYAAPHREYSRRIDYIFVRGPDHELRGEPVNARLAFDVPELGPSGRVWPSDHYGLVTEIILDPRNR
jgi:endonuclease/exonuclease/phosphatase family metal-dependent hydrolase